MSFISRITPRRAAMAASFAALLAATPALAAKAEVIITVPAGAKGENELAAKVAEWKQSGQISDTLWLRANQRDGGFQALLELEFPDETSYAEWSREDAAKIGSEFTVTRVDKLVHGEKSPRDSNYSVFKVNEYQPTTDAATTRDFARKYIEPLMQSQIGAKIMMRYSMYQARQADGKGKTWLVMEYRDPISFERSEDLKTGLRKTLLENNAGYAAYDKTKESLRTTGPETLSSYKELPAPNLPDLPAYKAETKLVGTLRIYGSELKNSVEYLAKGFQAFHPDLRITWSNATSSEGALAGLYTGIADVAPMGDDAKVTDQMPFYNAMGYVPTEISVSTGGYERRGSLWAWAIVVNKDNPLASLSKEQLENIFGSERTGGWKVENNNWLFSAEFKKDRSSDIRTWDQLGLKGAEYKGKEIQTYGYSAQGFQTAIERHWFHWSHKWNPNFKEYVEDKQAVAGPMGDVVKADRPLEILSRDKYGIGIAAMMHVKDYPNLKVLPIAPYMGMPAVPLTPKNVAQRKYPLIRDGYFYVAKAPGRPLDPKVREFMRFVLSREGQEIIAKVGYYYPLNAEYLAEQRKKLDN